MTDKYEKSIQGLHAKYTNTISMYEEQYETSIPWGHGNISKAKPGGQGKSEKKTFISGGQEKHDK